MESGIIVVGSLIPEKKIQDTVRVLDRGGICPGLRATDHKSPLKILEIKETSDGNQFSREL